jgi:hypothetical protein
VPKADELSQALASAMSRLHSACAAVAGRALLKGGLSRCARGKPPFDVSVRWSTVEVEESFAVSAGASCRAVDGGAGCAACTDCAGDGGHAGGDGKGFGGPGAGVTALAAVAAVGAATASSAAGGGAVAAGGVVAVDTAKSAVPQPEKEGPAAPG